MSGHRTGQQRFTYFMLLWWVALSGVMLAALGQQWRFERQRDKEAEMVARAEEIRAAIAAYQRQGGSWPSQLSDLVDDRRGPVPRRHLRRVWVDPLTGRADWGLLRGEASTTGLAEGGSGAAAGVHGVYSRAPGQPIRGPAGIRSYAEWHFEAAAVARGP